MGGGAGTAQEPVPWVEACGRGYGGTGSNGCGSAGRHGGMAVEQTLRHSNGLDRVRVGMMGLTKTNVAQRLEQRRGGACCRR